MDVISVPAHFDGERVQLDEPVEIEPNARLIVTILPPTDGEHDAWLRLSQQGLRGAYEDGEEDYAPDDVVTRNPDYAGR